MANSPINEDLPEENNLKTHKIDNRKGNYRKKIYRGEKIYAEVEKEKNIIRGELIDLSISGCAVVFQYTEEINTFLKKK